MYLACSIHIESSMYTLKNSLTIAITIIALLELCSTELRGGILF